MDNHVSDVQQKTEESKQQAVKEAGIKNSKEDNETIHTINPFTGTEVTITPEDLEGMQKKNEADTERD